MTKSMWTPARRTLIPKSWAFIWSWSLFAAITAFTLLERLSTRCWGLASIQQRALVKSGTDVRQLGLARQLAFQFIPKVFNGVEGRPLCRPVKFFHTDLDKPFLYGPRFVQRGIVMLKQETAFPKLLPQIWKHRII